MPIDPTKSAALLIGTSQFPNDPETLTPLEEVVHNLNDLKRLLRDNDVAGFEDVRVVFDENTSAIGREIDSIASDTQGTLLVYYAGHGVVRDGHFYLTGKDSIERSIWSSGIKFEDFRNTINRSPARRKVVILDACFSGRVIEGLASDAGVIDANVDEIEGAYTITSARGNQTAPAKSISGRHTGFTDILLQVIEHGIKDGGEWISVDNLYNAVRQLAGKTEGMPEPRRKYSDDIARFELFKNSARVQPDDFVGRTEFAELADKVDALGSNMSADRESLSGRISNTEEKLQALSDSVAELDAQTAGLEEVERLSTGHLLADDDVASVKLRMDFRHSLICWLPGLLALTMAFYMLFSFYSLSRAIDLADREVSVRVASTQSVKSLLQLSDIVLIAVVGFYVAVALSTAPYGVFRNRIPHVVRETLGGIFMLFFREAPPLSVGRIATFWWMLLGLLIWAKWPLLGTLAPNVIPYFE